MISASLKYLTKLELDTEVLEQKSCNCIPFTCPLESGLENSSHDGIQGVKANNTFKHPCQTLFLLIEKKPCYSPCWQLQILYLTLTIAFF